MTHEGGGMMPIPRRQSEIYHPDTGQWQAGAVADVVRLYHSVALLLPDGRVITASGNPSPYGNRAPWEPPQPNEELRLEVYRPPYLFRGARPDITPGADRVGLRADRHSAVAPGRRAAVGAADQPWLDHPCLRLPPAPGRPAHRRPDRRATPGANPGRGRPGPTRLVHAHRGRPGPHSLDSPLGPSHLSISTDGRITPVRRRWLLGRQQQRPSTPVTGSPAGGQGCGITGAAG
jgi:hypothetical protein